MTSTMSATAFFTKTRLAYGCWCSTWYDHWRMVKPVQKANYSGQRRRHETIPAMPFGTDLEPSVIVVGRMNKVGQTPDFLVLWESELACNDAHVVEFCGFGLWHELIRLLL